MNHQLLSATPRHRFSINTVEGQAKQQGFTAEKVSDALAAVVEKGGAAIEKAKEEESQAAADEGIKPPARNWEERPSENTSPS